MNDAYIVRDDETLPLGEIRTSMCLNEYVVLAVSGSYPSALSVCRDNHSTLVSDDWETQVLDVFVSRLAEPKDFQVLLEGLLTRQERPGVTSYYVDGELTVNIYKYPVGANFPYTFVGTTADDVTYYAELVLLDRFTDLLKHEHGSGSLKMFYSAFIALEESHNKDNKQDEYTQ